MAIIESERNEAGFTSPNHTNSSTLRLWHRLNAVVITGSLLTVLLNSTLLGVFLAERKERPGIVSDMINGGRN